MRNRSLFLIIILVLVIISLAYLLGRKSGSRTIDNIATNNSFIKQIAELSSLEVQGIASIKRTNLVNDGSFTDQMRKMFLENTVNITIPYIAKYGVNLQKQNISIEEEKKKIVITLPTPTLLSFELRMDSAQGMTKKGLLLTASEEEYSKVQTKLYAESKGKMQANANYIHQTKEKINEIIRDYYAPLNYKVEIVYKNN